MERHDTLHPDISSSRSSPIRIVLADDHSLVREGLTFILNAEPDFEVVGTASDGLEALERVATLRPDVVLMDLQMPKLDGVKAIEQLRTAFPEINIIILTTFETDDYIYDGIRAGARGYLLKDVPKEELCRTIRLVNQGQAQMQSRIATRLFELMVEDKSKARSSDNINILTERELEVLKLIARGDRNKEIAHKLSITESTVKGYISSILQKFNVSDRTEAAMYAVQKGLIKLGE